MAPTNPRQPLTTVPAGLSIANQGSGGVAGVQAPISYMREFHESRRIVEDFQRGTLEHTFYITGHPNEAYLDAGLTGLQIGNPHPWWTFSDLARDMYLVKRTFEKVNDRSLQGDRWTRVVLLYQKRSCPFSYEEEFTTSSTVMQHWWTRDVQNPNQPVAVPVTLAEGYPIPVPQFMLRRHWPSVSADDPTIRSVKGLQNKLNSIDFYGEPARVWLCESVQARRLYGSGTSRSLLNSTDRWEITITWRGDPVRHHELWVAKFSTGSVTPIRPLSMSFSDLAAVHHRLIFFETTRTNFDSLFVHGEQRCNP